MGGLFGPLMAHRLHRHVHKHRAAASLPRILDRRPAGRPAKRNQLTASGCESASVRISRVYSVRVQKCVGSGGDSGANGRPVEPLGRAGLADRAGASEDELEHQPSLSLARSCSGAAWISAAPAGKNRRVEDLEGDGGEKKSRANSGRQAPPRHRVRQRLVVSISRSRQEDIAAQALRVEEIGTRGRK